MDKKVITIGNTPLSYSIYSAESTETTMHDRGVLEIIFCLKGSVRFAYAYEEFTLNAEEFVSVDRDAYYLYKGKDNILVSFCINLLKYEDKYPNIRNNLFVCEGTSESTMKYPTRWYNKLKGLMISALKQISRGAETDSIQKISDSIVDLFVNHFDINFFHTKTEELQPEVIERVREITNYMSLHCKDRIILRDLAEHLNLTEGYTSEFMRKYSISFRKMLAYIRANESEWYLMNTNKTVVEISEECGFSDPQYYYSAFKQWYRCTPRQFRECYCKDIENDIEYLSIESIQNLLDEILTDHYLENFTTDLN
ncbi:MAG: helix-turn-helix transcriptional regulator [Clostridiales bacterium]|nr:helix-turn-helix transcriptional regulator [Clostridiales bacterium]